MSAEESRICSWCGNPMRGMASIRVGLDAPKKWYCHADERPSCYEKAQRQGVVRNRWLR